MIEKIKSLILSLNSKGVPIPMLTDPTTGKASVSLTMMVISFNVVLVGLIGKWSKALGDVDVQGAVYWFLTCSGLYLGRKMTTQNGKVDIENGEEK